MSPRLSISQMKARCTDYFFSKATRRFFRGSRNTAKYDRKTGQNYIKVTHASGRTAWYKFNARTGKTHYVAQDKLPKQWRKS